MRSVTPSNNIARIRAPRCATAQALMKGAIALWQSSGFRIVGMIEETHGMRHRVCNAGILRDIATGSTYFIYRESPLAGKKCRIDPSGAALACAAVLEQLSTCDLLVLSKFGKLEASGLGFFRAFAAAADSGTPVLTTVAGKNLAAWQAFAPNAAILGTILGTDLADLQSWWNEVH